MNPSIKKLAAIAGYGSRTIIGLMSGTSLDGLDIALCNITGSGEQTKVNLTHFVTKSYSEYHKSHLKKITSIDKVSLAELCWQHTWLATYHAELILEALKEWDINPEEVDCIASHGQTIYHLPARDQQGFPRSLNSTLQIADGDQIAAKTGVMTISDFRQKHTAHGGEGAPMAALVDRLLFGDELEPRILLNIGGIANFTYLPAGSGQDQGSFTTDTGPGNTLIDNLAYIYFQKPFDDDGMIAASGDINQKLLGVLLDDVWFQAEESKSTGPEYFNFNWIMERTEQAGINLKKIRPDDQLATVTELSAITIAENIKERVPGFEKCTIYISGGGAHNKHLLYRLKEHLKGTEFHDFAGLGFDPDAKEALIFAVLANEMIAGDGFDFEESGGEVRKINFGKISFPN
jgi:anhydro-N-acetylmuramic acid kinase